MTRLVHTLYGSTFAVPPKTLSSSQGVVYRPVLSCPPMTMSPQRCWQPRSTLMEDSEGAAYSRRNGVLMGWLFANTTTS